MREYGREKQLLIAFVNEGEGDVRVFNSNPFALCIADEIFPLAMNTLAGKIGRADLTALQCKGNVLLTDASGFGGTMKSAEKHLIEADIFFQKVPRIPKAEEMMEYEGLVDSRPYLFKSLPFGYGYRKNFTCLEIGVQLETAETASVGVLATIYRVGHYRQEFIDPQGTLLIVAGEKKYGHRNAPRDLFDLFGCCLKICRGDMEKAREMQRSSYVSWGRRAITKSALQRKRSEYAAVD